MGTVSMPMWCLVLPRQGLGMRTISQGWHLGDRVAAKEKEQLEVSRDQSAADPVTPREQNLRKEMIDLVDCREKTNKSEMEKKSTGLGNE